ncbi:hypothetical protein [Prosthecobacter fusiformis]|uniref:hypothetical protein n=1 Tax=Prosthecobacter fusiformis TaxID=48464 RepID=UPI001414E611|nr:hypothetical protein [Prosthecobacter fusiformis]
MRLALMPAVKCRPPPHLCGRPYSPLLSRDYDDPSDAAACLESIHHSPSDARRDESWN